MARNNSIMMIPGVRFKRVAEAFNEALVTSSGSEHFQSIGDHDLSDLVNSFIEKGLHYKSHDQEKCDIFEEEDEGDQGKYYCGLCDFDETKESLESLLNVSKDHGGDGNSNGENLKERELIIVACHEAIEERFSSQEISQGLGFSFRRSFMSRLRERGFDAGLCKSRWPRSERHPGGEYEYIDINIAYGDQKHRRYIVEIDLSVEFEIARPTSQHSTLLNIFPRVFVGQPEELKQVVRLMTRVIRESMKSMNLKVPPWRRNGYMEAKWFGPYKRTTNEIPSSHMGHLGLKHVVNNGFEVSPVGSTTQHCKEELVGKKGGVFSYLTAAFSGDAL